MGSFLSRGDAEKRKRTRAKFHEFNKGYTHKEELLPPYPHLQFVEMGKPRKCSYSKKTEYENRKFNVKETVTIGEPITRQKLRLPEGSAKITPMPVELRGITLRQLRAIKANMERRCEEEGWKDWKKNILTPEKVTLHDINNYIIKPYTEASESSFVETLPSTAGTQTPRFFVSHTWGETFYHTMDCIEQMVKDFKVNNQSDDNGAQDKKGGGMTQDTPIWICAFANNQHDLKAAITADPSESGFAKAMEVADYRTLSILDEKGEVFTRVWCILELDLTLIKVQEKKEKGRDCDDMDLEWNGLWAVYTAHDHTYLKGTDYGETRKAVGIVPGGATCDFGISSYTNLRQRDFPMDRILKGLDTMIQTANASIEHDKTHILNFISGSEDLNAEPPKEHEKYDALNDAVRGAFASSIAVLQSACRVDDDEWQRMLRVMSKSTKKDKMDFNFSAGEAWDDLSAERAVEMINHLPPSIEGLKIRTAPYGSPFMDAVIEWIEKSTNLKSLEINDTSVCGRNGCGGRDAGIKLAKTLAAKKSIEVLRLTHTDLMGSRNVDEWSKAFDKITSLKELKSHGLRKIIQYFDKSTFDKKTSTAQHPYDKKRQRIYWKHKTFPDATMKEEDVQKLKEATHARDVHIRDM